MPKEPGEQPREDEPIQESYADKMIREMKEKLEKEKGVFQGHVDELQRIREKNLGGETLTAEEREFLERATTSKTIRKFKEEQGEK